MKTLFLCFLVLVVHSAILRGTTILLGWKQKPPRIHALALIVWFTLFGLVQAVVSSILPSGSVSHYEILFVVVVVTLLNFLVLRVLYREQRVSTGVVAASQSVLFFCAAYFIAG